MASVNDLREKIVEYGTFIHRTLQPELRAAVSERDDVESEIFEYSDLRDQLQLLQKRMCCDEAKCDELLNCGAETFSIFGDMRKHDSLRLQNSTELALNPTTIKNQPLLALVDLSHGTLYCNAKIPNPCTIYVNIGFGFHAELTFDEAINFINKRLNYLETRVLKHRFEVVKSVARDIEQALDLLEQLGEDLGDLEMKC